MNVRLSNEQRIRVLNSADVYTIIQQILLRENKIRRNQEHFWVVGLDNKNKILFIELIGLGAVNRVAADPSDIFRMAIYKLAVNMVLVHNHPSGSVEPSQADLDMTDRMLKVGKLINIEVIDHLVISEKNYTSFEDEAIMVKLRKSGLFEIVERDKVELKQWKIDVEKDKAKHLEKKAIAKNMKEAGMDEKTIKKMTGLYMHEIRKL